MTQKSDDKIKETLNLKLIFRNSEYKSELKFKI